MTWRGALVAALDDLSVTGLTGRALRLLALVAAAGAWLAGVLAGAGDSPVAVTVLLLAAAWCAVVPDSQAGLLVPLALGWQWLAHLDRTTSGWVLLAALCLLVFHAAIALASSAPTAASLGRYVLRATARRTALIALVTAGVWLAVRWSPVTGRPGHLSLTVAALLVLTAGAAVAAVALRQGLPRSPSR
jgi:hypothetical protein